MDLERAKDVLNERKHNLGSGLWKMGEHDNGYRYLWQMHAFLSEFEAVATAEKYERDAKVEANQAALLDLQPGDAFDFDGDRWVVSIAVLDIESSVHVVPYRLQKASAAQWLSLEMLRCAAYSPSFKVVKAKRAADDKGREV